MNNNSNDETRSYQEGYSKKTTILIVDDHKLVSDSLMQVLGSNHLYKVVAVSFTAEEGIRDALTFKPGIVIIDIKMPGMSGIDAVELIRNVNACPSCNGQADAQKRRGCLYYQKFSHR